MAPAAHAQTAINTGGGTAGSFVADTGYLGGTAVINPSANIDTTSVANPAPLAVYQSARYGNFSYVMAGLAPAATYRVRLHFAEFFWTQAGKRVFNVTINNVAYLSNFDIVAAAGGANKAVVKEFAVPASAAGNILIQFTTVVDNAMVGGIEVLPNSTNAINAGGGTAGGFVADAGYSGGTAVVQSGASINTANVTNPAPLAVYQSARYGNFSYTIARLTPAATYRVRLHFAEFFWTKAGQRVFNVTMNNVAYLSRFDIVAAAGGANKAVIKEFNVPASAAGNIVIQFTTVVDNAMVNGIEVLAGSVAATGVPAAPLNVSAVAGNATATVSWAAVSGVAGYNVKRSLTSGGPYTAVAGNIATTSYANTGLTNGTTYYYVVSAVNSAGESANSAQVSALPAVAISIPAAPSGLSAVAGNAAATISWPAVANAASYNVKRSPTSGGPFTAVASNIVTTSYANTSLTNGTTYYYVVSAVNSAGESANSAQVSVLPVAASTGDSPTANLLGITLAGTLDFLPERLYADLIRMSRDFMSGSSKAAVDSNGWPTSDFTFYVWAGIDQMNGTYALSFKGQASVSGNSIGNVALSYDPTSNTSSGTFQYADTGSASLGLTFTGTRRTGNSAAGTGVTQIKLMRPLTPGSTATHAPSELFNRATKTALAKFRVLRFMDFLATNGNAQVNWSDRPLPTWASFSRNPGGIYGWEGIGGPLEHVIQLSNELGRDPWINIPARASDDYVRNVALLFAYGSDGVNPYTSPQANPVYPPLNPGLNLYVEYANELWNTSSAFTQSIDNCKAASSELVSTSGNSPLNYDKRWNGVAYPNSGFDWAMCWRRTAKRGAEISTIFRSVFGDAAMGTRVRPELMSQLGYPTGPLFAALQMMFAYYNNGEGNYVANPHPPSYYFYGAGGSGYYSPALTVSTLNALFADPGMTPAGFTPPLQQDMALVSAMGLKRIAYEGGPSLDKTGGVRDAVSAQAVNDPRMTTTVVNMHNAWSSNGGDLLVYANVAGDYQWGFTSSVYNLATPKYAAVDALNTAQRSPVTYGTLIPGSIVGSTPAICSRGWGCNPIQPANFASDGSQVLWAIYPFRAMASGQRTVTLNFGSASAAQVAVYVDGVLIGTQSTAGAALIFNAGPFGAGVHGVLVRAVSGKFLLNSVAVQ